MQLGLLVVFLPLLGSLISGFFGKFIKTRYIEILTCLLVSVSAILSCLIFYDVIENSYSENILLFTWISSGTFNVNWSIYIDSLSALMFIVITLVSSLVHIYSIGYMSDDPHKPRFMSYLSLFTFSMLVLVSSDNFLQLFFGWEGVGLCSYLLIGFWFKKETANAAAIKAFIVNRVGDFGLALGIFLVFYLFGSVNYQNIFSEVPNFVNSEISIIGINFNTINLICVFLFIGAMGKSVQIFLHTWLPDAMEGPTPVSALIHAATMVTAGVFLIVRCSPIYEYSELALNLITIVGMSTAFFAATVALVQNDIKKIIAYSTCSQLGYMFFAAGVGAYNVAMFHLFTHAFFKALLFLGAGSVIHSFHNEQNIENMGGVWKKLPFTWILMIIGTLALTGFPFLSGFYSKDAILEFAFLKGSTIGYLAAGVGVITAIMTSIYSWRLLFKTFHGSFKNTKFNLSSMHESPLVMIVPLVILSVGAIFSGFLFKEIFISSSSTQNFWKNSIFFMEPLSQDHPPTWFLLMTPILVTITIPFSHYIFVKNTNILKLIVDSNYPVFNFFKNKWYFDEAYDFIFVKGSKKLGLLFWKKIDIRFIDKFGPDGISSLIKFFSLLAIKFQSGFIYQYAFIMLIGFSILLTFLILY